MIVGSGFITLSRVKDVASVTRYYMTQPASSPSPTKPQPNAVLPTGWSTTEPTYTAGGTDVLYTMEKTTYSDGSWDYSDVSLSSSFEAAKAAYNQADNAMTAANGKNKVFHQPSTSTPATNGLTVGDTWFVTDFGYRMRTWNGSQWVSEQLGQQAIAAEAIQTAHLDAGVITTDKIQAHNVTAEKIDIADLFAQDITATGSITSPILKTSNYNGTVSQSQYIDPEEGVQYLTTYDINNTVGSIINMASGTLNIGGGKFVLNSSGTATLGGWTVGTYKIYAGDSSSGVVAVQTPSSTRSWVFAAGGTSHSSYTDCPFRVHKDGSMYSTKGNIGGFSITATSLMHRFELSTTGIPSYRFYIRTGTEASENAMALQYCASSSQEASENPNDWTWTNLFRVTYNGDLLANSVRAGTYTDSYSNVLFQRVTYPVYWNNAAILRFATKTTNKTPSSANGTAFMLANGLYAAGSTGSVETTSEHVYLVGGCDSTSRWMGSPTIYKREYNASANVVITSNGILGRSTSSSIRYKHDVEYLTNEDLATIDTEKIAKQAPQKKARLASSTPQSDTLNIGGNPNLDSILNIPIVTFKYNDGYVTGEADFDYDKPIAGFIAEDIAQICPECATYIEDENGEKVPEAWDSNQIIVRMLYVLQKQQKEIKELKELINEQ